MYIFFLIALRNLFRHKTRSLVLGGAIGGVAFLLTVLISLVSGIRQTMIKNGTALMTGHINIAGFYKISSSSASSVVVDYQKLSEIAKREVPEAKLIIDRMKAYGKIISEQDSIQLPIWGIDIKQESSILGQLALAHPTDYMTSEELKKYPHFTSGAIADLKDHGTLVIFAAQAKKLGVHVGDMLTISMPTYRNISNTMDVRLVAILKDIGLMSQFSSFLNTEDAKKIYQVKPTTSGQIMIFLKDINDVPVVEERLRKVISKEGYTLMEKDPQPFFLKFDRVSGESWTGQRIDITTWEDETSFLKWIIQLLNGLSYGLIFILLIVVVIGLMNSLWMSIRERTAEIGTLRAIGLQKRQVFLMFFMESSILSIVTTLIGVGVGAALTKLLNSANIPLTSEALKMFLMSDTLSFEFGASELFNVLVIMIVFLIFGSLLPTWQATRLKPVTAMQS